MIHYKKNFSYIFFAFSLIGHCPNLERIRVFGTDGEKALPLKTSLCTVFDMLYSRKKSTSNIPSEVSKIILDDIFGHKLGTGLLDSIDNDDFDTTLLINGSN